MSQEVLHLPDGDEPTGFQVILTHCNGGDGPWEAEVYRRSADRFVLLYNDDYAQVRSDAVSLVAAATGS